MPVKKFFCSYPRYKKYEDMPVVEQIYEYLSRPDMIGRMLISINEGKPALLPAADELGSKFEEQLDFRDYTLKQMIGAMIREILKDYGYEPCGSKLINSSYFKSGACYLKKRKEKKEILLEYVVIDRETDEELKRITSRISQSAVCSHKAKKQKDKQKPRVNNDLLIEKIYRLVKKKDYLIIQEIEIAASSIMENWPWPKIDSNVLVTEIDSNMGAWGKKLAEVLPDFKQYFEKRDVVNLFISYTLDKFIMNSDRYKLIKKGKKGNREYNVYIDTFRFPNVPTNTN